MNRKTSRLAITNKQNKSLQFRNRLVCIASWQLIQSIKDCNKRLIDVLKEKFISGRQLAARKRARNHQERKKIFSLFCISNDTAALTTATAACATFNLFFLATIQLHNSLSVRKLFAQISRLEIREPETQTSFFPAAR